MSPSASSVPLYDIAGIGLGPFNLGLAALLEPVREVKAVFLEQKPSFRWHEGMLLEGTTLQVPFLADMVTMADPTSRFSYLKYLADMGRLYHFYFYEHFHIPRTEYDHYCQWVARQLESCQFDRSVSSIRKVREGGESCYEVEARSAAGQAYRYRARHLVLGVGTTPVMPESFKGLPSEAVFHTAEFSSYREQCRKARSVTVIGSGQSAGECFLALLQEQKEYGFRLSWFTRSSGFHPMEYTKLGLQHFSPEYTRYFHGLPQAVKDRVLPQQDLLYKGMSTATLAAIHDLLYERSVGGEVPAVQMRALCEVTSARQTPSGPSRFRLQLRQRQQGKEFHHDTDCVVVGTGYRAQVPGFLSELRPLIHWDEQGRYIVGADYRVAQREESTNHIFVQNGEIHTHGVGAPDLGLGAHRNSIIINSLLGRDVYKTRERNVFIEFGAPE
jgi:lysine N6-hydroxylase